MHKQIVEHLAEDVLNINKICIRKATLKKILRKEIVIKRKMSQLAHVQDVNWESMLGKCDFFAR